MRLTGPTGRRQTGAAPASLPQALLAVPFNPAAHALNCDSLPLLRKIEAGGPCPPCSMPDAARLIFWNVELLRYLGAIGEPIAAQKADVVLLSVVERGMARTGAALPSSIIAPTR